MNQRLRSRLADGAQRSAECWAAVLGILLSQVALKLGLLASPFGAAVPANVGSVVMACAGLLTLGGLAACLAHVLSSAAAIRRRRLERDVAAATAALVAQEPLVQWLQVEAAPEEEIRAQQRRVAAAQRRQKACVARCDSHQRPGRAVRIRRIWVLVIGAFAVGVAAHPWITWTVDSAGIALYAATATEVVSGLFALVCLRGLLRDGSSWPAERPVTRNTRSLSPAYLVCAIPPLTAYLWHGLPAPTLAATLAAAGAALLVVPTLVALQYLFASPLVAQLDKHWRRVVLPHQRRVEGAAVHLARALGVALAGCAVVFGAFGVAVISLSPDTAVASLTGAATSAIAAYGLARLGDLRVERDGDMIPAGWICETIDAHPLRASGLTVVFVALGGLMTVLGHVL